MRETDFEQTVTEKNEGPPRAHAEGEGPGSSKAWRPRESSWHYKHGLWIKTVPNSSPGLVAIRTSAGNLTSLSLGFILCKNRDNNPLIRLWDHSYKVLSTGKVVNKHL